MHHEDDRCRRGERKKWSSIYIGEAIEAGIVFNLMSKNLEKRMPLIRPVRVKCLRFVIVKVISGHIHRAASRRRIMKAVASILALAVDAL